MTANISNDSTQPNWLREMDNQLRRGKHIILYGNVDDCFPGHSGRSVPLSAYLNHYFNTSGYEQILYYDVVDGLRRADGSSPVGSERIPEHSPSASPSEPAMQSGPPETSESRLSRRSAAEQGGDSRFYPERQEPATHGGTAPLSLAETDRFNPNRVADHLRKTVFPQTVVPSVVVFEYSDKLFADAQRLETAERQLLVTLKKCVAEAVETLAPQMGGRKNAMLIVASQLGALPTWFYQEHPLLALVKIPKPSKEERQTYIDSVYPIITDNQSLPSEVRHDIIDHFTELTNDLTLHDLASIGKMCEAEEITVTTPRQMKDLIAYYRFGMQKDPWEDFDMEKVKMAPDEMRKRVLGQDHAIAAIVDMLISANVGLSFSPPTNQSGKPRGVFFFVGPTGVGKTELAKALTELIFRDEHRMRRFDMSEYAEKHAAEKLTGAPPGYVGYEAGGQLTNYVRENPFSLLLFDEIEKADQKVMDKFLQILEDGRLSDSKGQTSYFSQSAITFTSNIGSDTFAAKFASGNLPTYEEVRRHYLECVRHHFETKIHRPEIFNRFGDNILVFDLLRPEFIRPIARKFLNFITRSASDKKSLTCTFDESVYATLEARMLEDGNLSYGGRRVRTLLEEMIEKPLNKWLFHHPLQPGTSVTLSLSSTKELIVETR